MKNGKCFTKGLLCKKPVDYSLKLGKGSSPHQGAAVDEKRWSAGNAERETIMQIFGHFLPITSGVQACGKDVLVKPDLFGKLGEVPSCPRCLAVKQAVVVFPKLPLVSRALGGLGGLLRMWVIRTGIIPIHHLDLVRVLRKDFLDQRHAELAVRALEI